ncbi:MAG: BlaI/MecI/CopY family transcriptional regulator [Planctomycetota bacterium]
MARPPAKHPTELELEILKILWNEGERSAQQVRASLERDAGRPLARTSVVTTLNIMNDKGWVSRKQSGKAHLFEAAVSQEAVSSNMLSDLVTRVFDGSAEAVVLKLIESEEIDDEELRSLRRLINRKRKERE